MGPSKLFIVRGVSQYFLGSERMCFAQAPFLTLPAEPLVVVVSPAQGCSTVLVDQRLGRHVWRSQLRVSMLASEKTPARLWSPFRSSVYDSRLHSPVVRIEAEFINRACLLNIQARSYKNIIQLTSHTQAALECPLCIHCNNFLRIYH